MSDLRDVVQALRALSKSMARIESDTTDSARAIEEISTTLLAFSERLKALDELVEALPGIERSLRALPDMVKALGALTSKVMEHNERLNKYVDATAENDGRLRSRVSALEDMMVENYGKRQ